MELLIDYVHVHVTGIGSGALHVSMPCVSEVSKVHPR